MCRTATDQPRDRPRSTNEPAPRAPTSARRTTCQAGVPSLPTASASAATTTPRAPSEVRSRRRPSSTTTPCARPTTHRQGRRSPPVPAGRQCGVVATGGRPVEELGELPGNARAAEFLPYDRLLPKTDVFVTNAGFGGTQYALSHGVPIVAAGDTEDKPEVAMRVEWSGVGVNLRTGTPNPAAVARAVDEVLADRTYRDRARAMATRIRDYDTFDLIEAELEASALAGSLRLATPVG